MVSGTVDLELRVLLWGLGFKVEGVRAFGKFLRGANIRALISRIGFWNPLVLL